MRNKKIDLIRSSVATVRKERILNGTWMPRSSVHTSKKQYNRRRDRSVPAE